MNVLVRERRRGAVGVYRPTTRFVPFLGERRGGYKFMRLQSTGSRVTCMVQLRDCVGLLMEIDDDMDGRRKT